jgi:phosphoglycolate phosphatase-like HAD superfamily hydrolase
MTDLNVMVPTGDVRMRSVRAFSGKLAGSKEWRGTTLGGYSAILFDFDDTLMATRETRVPLIVDTLAELGCHVELESVIDHWGKPFPRLIGCLAPSVDYEVFHQQYSERMSSQAPVVLPGAAELLKRLRDLGARVEIVSSGSRKLVLHDLEAGGLMTYVGRVWACEDTDSCKPDPQVLDRPLAQLEARGIPRRTVAYVGDSLADFRVAHSQELPFVGVLTGLQSRGDFLAAGVPSGQIVDTLRALRVRPA